MTSCPRRDHLVSRLATPRAQIGLTSCHIATPLRAMYPTSTRRLCFCTVFTRGVARTHLVPRRAQKVRVWQLTLRREHHSGTADPEG